MLSYNFYLKKEICNEPIHLHLSLAAASTTITQTKKAHQSLQLHSFKLTPFPIIQKMKPNGCVSFKYKNFFNPCKRIVQAFKFKLRKPLFIRKLQFHRRQPRATTPKRKHFAKLRSLFQSRKSKGEMDRVMELKSFSDAGHCQKAPCPSPLTPAYVKMAGVRKVISGQEDVEDACRSFENYLVEMIVEEGKMRDLADVEELLYCWKNLKSPVFINLVCRFYGELCKDLFSNTTAEEDDTYGMV